MKPNQLIRMATVGVLWLCVGAGCRKEPATQPTPTSCRDGTCCGPKGIHYLYAETYENTLVTLGESGGIWGVAFNKPIPTGTPNTWKTAAEICDLTLDGVIKITQQTGTDDKTGIKCRVWGRLYIGDEMPTLTVGAPRFFAIDKIEVVK